MEQEVNATQVSREEKLSDHVYEYDAKEKELYRADKAEEHEQKHAKEKEASRDKVSIKDKLIQNKAKAVEINKNHDKSHEKKKEVAL